MPHVETPASLAHSLHQSALTWGVEDRGRGGIEADRLGDEGVVGASAPTGLQHRVGQQVVPHGTCPGGQRSQGARRHGSGNLQRLEPVARDTDSPRFRVGVLLMSPAMKEDSVCFLTVSFHILRIRLWGHSANVRGPLGPPPSRISDHMPDKHHQGPCLAPWPGYLGPCVVAGVAPHG